MMRLRVLYEDQHIGTLETTANKGVLFSYTPYALAPISISMPDLKRIYSEKECLPFFEGLLPEGEIRRQIAEFAHVPASSVMKLLDRYGADIAGALVIEGEESSTEETTGYLEISDKEISQKISQKSRIPMIFSGERIRLSLAGAENKIPVLFRDGRFYLPLGKAASSHIIKAADEFVENEYICNRLAFHCGLPVPEMSIVDIVGKRVLLIKRFDRTINKDGSITRLHQEDFCQALGFMSRNKYEENGGPGLDLSFSLILNNSANSIADYRNFLGVTVFNYLIGNCDAHAKNFSFLYNPDLSKKRLAPFYDIVCSSIYEQFDKSLAMRVGKHRELDRLTSSDFESITSRRLMRDVIENLVSVFSKAVDAVEKEADRNQHVLLSRIVSDSNKRIEELS